MQLTFICRILGMYDRFPFKMIYPQTGMKVQRCVVALIATLACLLIVPRSQAVNSPQGVEKHRDSLRLESGGSGWHPQSSPKEPVVGPVVIIVSLPARLLSVYRDGVSIGSSTISTGKPGDTPITGVFTLLRKNVKQSVKGVTWSSGASQERELTRSPDSHSCVRVPLDFARELYAVTENGTTVVVTDHRAGSHQKGFSALLFSTTTEAVSPSGRTFWHPSKAPKGPVSIIISSADEEVYVYRNGVQIGRSPFGGLRGLVGLYVYSALADVDAGGRRSWLSIASMVGRAPQIRELIQHVSINQEFIALTRGIIETGTTLILTDAPVNSGKPNASLVDILTTETSP